MLAIADFLQRRSAGNKAQRREDDLLARQDARYEQERADKEAARGADLTSRGYMGGGVAAVPSVGAGMDFSTPFDAPAGGVGVGARSIADALSVGAPKAGPMVSGNLVPQPGMTRDPMRDEGVQNQIAVRNATREPEGPREFATGTSDWNEHVRRSGQLSAATRAPERPERLSPSESRLAVNDARRQTMDRVRGSAQLIAREGERVDSRNLALILRGQFPQADRADIDAIVAETLMDRDRTSLQQEGQRSVIDQRERNASGSGFSAMLAERSGGGFGGAPSIPGGKRDAQAAPAQKPAAERVQELKAQGVSRDEARAIMIREGYRF